MKHCYSCVVDSQPIFYFQAWNLVNSLLVNAKVDASQIYVNCVNDVHQFFLDEIQKLGVNINFIERFGDKKYCNKIAQLDNEEFGRADCVFLLDSDMIVLDKIQSLYSANSICGKIVDYPNPKIDLLKKIYDLAGFDAYPKLHPVDCVAEDTFFNNLNGGLYVVPGKLIKPLSEKWKKWALFLLSNISILQDSGKESHVDQISFSMAVHELNIKIRNLPRKYNYPVHLNIKHVGRPVILHYHRCISKHGLLQPANSECDKNYLRAIQRANSTMSKSFNNKIFWSFRYQKFPELGSGIGSRSDNASYKQRLLKQSGLETSPSILDIGCGDLEVIKDLQLNNYTGVDTSPFAIAEAIKKRPDCSFILLSNENHQEVPSAHTVLCLEVLIHQKDYEDYQKVVDLLASKTLSQLIVSGYTCKQKHHDSNHMLGFHENIIESLQKTRKFSSISVIGSHSDVDVVLAKV